MKVIVDGREIKGTRAELRTLAKEYEILAREMESIGCHSIANNLRCDKMEIIEKVGE